MKLNIAVVFGGRSVEHEISIISALQTIKVLDPDKYSVIPLYITKQGEWYTGDKLLELDNFRDLDQLLVKSQKVILNQNSGKANFYLEPTNIFSKRTPIKIDLIFPVIHGTYGEDGTIQGLFETMNIPYVGCNVLSSAATMDKVVTKKLLKDMGINLLDYYAFYGEDWIGDYDAIVSEIKTKFNYPVIVKPVNLGSSVGVAAVNNDEELENAVDLVVSLSPRVLIEPFISNLKEVNCAILGDRGSAEVSVCEEPIRSKDILSYQDKYVGGTKSKGGKIAGKSSEGGMSSAKRKVPAEIPQEMSDKIRGLAKKAFIELDCNGVVRADFLIDQDDNDKVYLCELNTIPGSLSFYLWEPAGKDFASLAERLIELALKRHRETNNLVVSYRDNILKG